MRFISFFASALVACSATAQDLGGALDLGQLGSTIGVSNAVRHHVTGSKASKQSGSRAAPLVAKQASSAGSLRFTADSQRRERTVQQWLASTAKSDPKTAAQFKTFFKQQNLGRIATEYLRPYGMTPSNGADAAAMYLSGAWLVTKNDLGDPTNAQMRGLRDQLASAMAATPGWANSSNETKQAFADALLLQSVVNSSLLQSAQGDAGRLREVKKAVAEGVRKSFGLDLTKLTLSNQGFVET